MKHKDAVERRLVVAHRALLNVQIGEAGFTGPMVHHGERTAPSFRLTTFTVYEGYSASRTSPTWPQLPKKATIERGAPRPRRCTAGARTRAAIMAHIGSRLYAEGVPYEPLDAMLRNCGSIAADWFLRSALHRR